MSRQGFSRSRVATRALALTPAVLAVTSIAPATAVSPVMLAETDPGPMDFLTILVLIPGALFGLIWLLTAIPGMARGDSTYQPGLAWRNEPEWFGGPRGGLDTVDAPPQVEAADAPERGGASGRW